MSNAHIGSRLLLKGVVQSVPFDSAHIDFKQDGYGVWRGKLLEPDPFYNRFAMSGVGRFSNSVSIEEGTVNLTLPRSYAISHGGTGSMATISDSSDTYNGEEVKLYRLTPNSALQTGGIKDAANSRTYGITIDTAEPYEVGVEYTASIYWRQPWSPSSSGTVQIMGNRSTAGVVWTDVVTIDVGGGWKRTIAKLTPVSTALSSPEKKVWRVVDPNAANGNLIEIQFTSPQIEKKPYPTRFARPNTPRFSSTLGYSPSVFNPNSFTFNAWVQVGLNSIKNQPIFEVNTPGGGLIGSRYVLCYGEDKRLALLVGDTGVYLTPFVPQENKWHMISARFDYDTKTFSLFADGLVVFSGPSASGAGILSVHPDALFWIGGNPNATGCLNGYVEDLLLIPKAVSDEDVAAWYLSEVPLYNRYDTRIYAC